LGICFQHSPVSGQTFYCQFFASGSGLSNSGHGFFRKFRITVAPETSQILFACTATALPAANPFFPSFAQISEPPYSVLRVTEPTPVHSIADFVPADMKHLLQKYPSILRTGDVMPISTYGVEHYIHTGPIPQFLQNPVTLIQKNLRLLKKNSNVWNPLALFAVQN
jgi:hypothetical protein